SEDCVERAKSALCPCREFFLCFLLHCGWQGGEVGAGAPPVEKFARREVRLPFSCSYTLLAAGERFQPRQSLAAGFLRFMPWHIHLLKNGCEAFLQSHVDALWRTDSMAHDN